MPQHVPHVVVLGAGFGGLYAAKKLARGPVRVTIIDRRNHHLFQPLLYEVATAALSPADIAEPVRRIFSRYRNVRCLLANARSVDPEQRTVHLDRGSISYDFLIIATGLKHSYFGHDEWAEFAPGLKSIEDAVEIRRRFLLAFEAAEREEDPEAQRRELTFVIIGAGPTGLELAGTMSELARRSIPRDFRAIDTTTARVILIEAKDRVLPTGDPELSARAKAQLEALGVEVRLNSMVEKIDAHGVTLKSGERIDTDNVVWAAGVQATTITGTLGCECDRTGRVIVQPDLSVPDHPEVFVIGDTAKAMDEKTGEEVPGIAPGAIQMGQYVGRLIVEEAQLGRGRSTSERRPFHYIDKGMLSTIGRAKAVGTIFGRKVSGLLAWLAWALVHIVYLVGFRNRVIVMLRWAWAYLMFQRGSRLISGGRNTHLADHADEQAAAELEDVNATLDGASPTPADSEAHSAPDQPRP